MSDVLIRSGQKLGFQVGAAWPHYRHIQQYSLRRHKGNALPMAINQQSGEATHEWHVGNQHQW